MPIMSYGAQSFVYRILGWEENRHLCIGEHESDYLTLLDILFFYSFFFYNGQCKCD